MTAEPGMQKKKAGMEERAIRALLVEDDPESGEAVQAMLERRGVEVTTAKDGAGALKLLDMDALDIVVADIRLGGGMSGVDILRRVREISLEFPVILLTGFDTLDSAIQAVRLGAQDYILKPLDAIEDLLVPIQKAARNYRTLLEKRRLEAALRESEERFRTLSESTSDWIWEVDENGAYTYSNPKVKQLLGYEPEEMIGKTPFDLMPPEESTRVAAEFSDIVRERKNFDRLENVNLHKDGRIVALETSGVPILNANGDFKGYRGIDRDITERKRLQEEITAIAKQERETLCRDLHDSICQQLVGIGFLAKKLQKKLTRKSAEEADIAAEVGRLTENTIELTQQITKGLRPLSEKPEALTSALSELASHINAVYGIKCRFTSRQPAPMEDRDVATQFFLIAQEAARNAATYAKPRRIGIFLSKLNGAVTLAISDDGIGFSVKKQEHKGMGMEIMHSRARIIGAILDIRSRKNGGSVVTCTWRKSHTSGAR